MIDYFNLRTLELRKENYIAIHARAEYFIFIINLWNSTRKGMTLIFRI